MLSRRLGYRHLETADVGWKEGIRGVLFERRILKAFPQWIGRGRLLDVGCASGKFLRQMGAVGWDLTGIEFDQEAAAKAKEVTPKIFLGDPTEAQLPARSFDLITAFHVIEHLPDPLGALRRMVSWLAPDGLIIVEVPNVGGLGGRLFGRYWSGLELPRHLIHFTPETMRGMVERAGGLVVGVQHKSKPRYFIRSLRSRLGDGKGRPSRLALALVRSRVGAGLLKLLLELVLPLAELARQGEAVRYFIRRRDEAQR